MYDEEIEKVSKSQTVHHYQTGEYIIKEGQHADQIFILLEGVAELEKQAVGGRIRVERIKQGEVFGLLMLLDEKPYSIDIIARTPCAVLEIKHRSIMSLFDKNPRIFAVMTLNICRILGRRLRSSYSRLGELKVQAADSDYSQGRDSGGFRKIGS